MRHHPPFAALLTALLAACTSPPRDPGTLQLRAEPWPAAEALFHREPRWLGGDAVWSIDLGDERVLWLFGDSFVATSDAHVRSQSTMVRNSIALQTGRDVTTATMAFHWRETNGTPSAFFAAPDDKTWYWPAHGARVGDELVLFLWHIGAIDTGLGFTGLGWTAVVVPNPDDPPMQWRLEPCRTDATPALALGSSVLVHDGWLHAFGTGLTAPSPTTLARWPLAAIAARDLRAPQWFAGERGFVPQRELASAPPEVAPFGQTEFTVLPMPGAAPFLVVHSEGFGGSTLAFRTAPAVAGPWSPPRTFFSPADRTRDGILIYAAKVHPMLALPDGEFAVSYSTNHLSFPTLVQDTGLCFPRFLRCRFVPMERPQ